jgi:hypothetical protein
LKFLGSVQLVRLEHPPLHLDLDDQVEFVGICDFDQMAHQVGQQLDLAFGLLQDLDQEAGSAPLVLDDFGKR